MFSPFDMQTLGPMDYNGMVLRSKNSPKKEENLPFMNLPVLVQVQAWKNVPAQDPNQLCHNSE